MYLARSLLTYVAGSGLDLAGPSSVAQALGVLAAIVAIHEAGHFTAARVQGVHVTKFAIGFGPALLRYQVNLLKLLPTFNYLVPCLTVTVQCFRMSDAKVKCSRASM